MAAKKSSVSENKLVATLKDYQQVFGTKAGERVLHDLMGFSGYRLEAFPKNEYEAGFAGGQRSIVNRILNQVFKDMGLFLEHMRIMEERRQHER